ncbi:amidohydrolase [Flavobacteriaceae bacterium 14752]|uniref:amidohydrolase n=1 Tax=Mesohalobacter salilacus TaxID=2491711 RepID=UPI000F63832C|nr:amidohydrolase [Flavobacteriaceae bacterium 14752]
MKKIFYLCLIGFLISCQNPTPADLIVYNSKIYTVDSVFSVQEAMAIKDGKILEVNTTENILKNYQSDKKLELKDKFIYPGINDAHAHLYGLGQNLRGVNLKEAKSFDEIVQRLVDYQNQYQSEFILGRGWDQNDWDVKDFPTKDTLDFLFPDTPIALTRIDGHAMLVNQKALDLAGIDENTEANGGEIIKENDKLTGVLVDNPMSKIKAIIPPLTKAEVKEALLKAEAIALENGLTSLTDAGLSKEVILTIKEMHKNNELKIRINAMVSNTREDIDYFLNKGILKTPRLRVGSVKVYADGALGSRGAALKEPYTDQANHFGAMVISLDNFDDLAKKLAKSEFQMNTHAIGDSANSVVLKTYQKYLNETPDRRWRVEHAQVLDSAEYNYFSKNIIPSVQPTHATSDMYWAEDRLGEQRIKHAYAYKRLLDEAGVLPLGTDFPVEEVNPMLTFYAAVSRQDTKGYPENGFQPQNALSRKATLKGMTIWAAFAAFEDQEKGSLEVGKFADFIILNKDLMTIDVNKVPELKVQKTYINGELVYENN